MQWSAKQGSVRQNKEGKGKARYATNKRGGDGCETVNAIVRAHVFVVLIKFTFNGQANYFHMIYLHTYNLPITDLHFQKSLFPHFWLIYGRTEILLLPSFVDHHRVRKWVSFPCHPIIFKCYVAKSNLTSFIAPKFFLLYFLLALIQMKYKQAKPKILNKSNIISQFFIYSFCF